MIVCLLLPVQGLSQQLDDEGLQAGLIGRFADEHGNRCVRVDRTISFAWADRPTDRRLGRGRFSASWRGYLMSQAPGDYRLYVYAAGWVQVKLNGDVILQGEAEQPRWFSSTGIALSFDWHPLEIAYRKTARNARLAFFWSGPQFQLEPVGPRRLYHDAEQTPDEPFGRGASLVRALRCGACHAMAGQPKPLAAADLGRLAGNLRWQWLIGWLGDAGGARHEGQRIARRMPNFELTPPEAEAITAFLLAGPKRARKRKMPEGDAQAGERLFLTVGCLACHQVGRLGRRGLFGGGDLSAVAEKRPPEFFTAWLADPAKINRDHRMPVFDLSPKERNDLAAYLMTLGSHRGTSSRADAPPPLVGRGRQLFIQHRCAACHAMDGKRTGRSTPYARPIDGSADWPRACTGAPDPSARRPGYWLCRSDAEAVRRYVTVLGRVQQPAAPRLDGQSILAERNCLACHARDASPGMAAQLPGITAAHPDLESLSPAMVPPGLASVGDKLDETALAEAITRRAGVHWPWLKVRMPKFNLSDEELQTLIEFFVGADRIPPGRAVPAAQLSEPAMRTAGARLVTSDGFGCTSCHQIGKVVPPEAPLSTRGTDLSMLGRRIRRPWFDRWVRNPARIVPRMDMPSVQLPVRGVLDDNLDDQLAAVWYVLNQPGFQPPEPNAIRVVRRSGVPDRPERAAVLTDVLRFEGQTFVKPLVIGLPNRHTVFFDFVRARLAGWWIGDVARQRTEGKTWYWEAGGMPVLEPAAGRPEITLEQDGTTRDPLRVHQYLTEPDWWQHLDGAVSFQYRLLFPSSGPAAGAQRVLRVRQTFAGLRSSPRERASGFRRQVTISGAGRETKVTLRVVAQSRLPGAAFTADRRTVTLGGPAGVCIRLLEPQDGKFDEEGSVTAAGVDGPNGAVSFQLEYRTTLPVDQFPVTGPAVPSPEPVELRVVPGYEAIRLPITEELMPTGLAWQPDGTLIVTSLKGRVWLARDTDGDGLEDQVQRFGDELAAPFGAAGCGRYIDVINKYGLLRLFDEDRDGRAERTELVASGWGHTTDYHDWAVGLPRDEQGNYYVALPCQQDERTPAAARLRGRVVKLVAREPTAAEPRRFALQVLSGGHRFPMGLARSRQGALFVTDNQGNYNPFNELNHVIQGARYGFINALERRPGFHPPLTPPAVDIPHPWTRSVNGICFLATPAAVRRRLGRDLFGPFEGHLLGCEYDTRRLIRISLQRIGRTYQGAAYPFSYERPIEGPPLLGPLTCAVAPDGDLYVGCIRDSGWGGANNIGTLVRLRPKPGQLPAGIAQVRATPDGFRLDFTKPVDRVRAADPENYLISSYTRVSTPEYGGPDKARRVERIRGLQVSRDGTRVLLRLGDLRPGFVYEFRLKQLTDEGELFHPAEAYYTLRQVPGPSDNAAASPGAGTTTSR